MLGVRGKPPGRGGDARHRGGQRFDRCLRDGAPRRYPEAKWAPTGANLGYGTAAEHRRCVVDDRLSARMQRRCRVEPGFGGAPAELPRGAASGGSRRPAHPRSDGVLYPSARRFPDLLEAFGHGILGQFWVGNPFSRRYRMDDWDHAKARMVDWVSGACFLVRRSAWDAVGGFDRSYFMYMEDVDLCWRLARAGWSVAYEPAAEVAHAQGVSTDRNPYRMLFAHHVSMWRFARRTSADKRRWLLPLVLAGLCCQVRADGGSPGAGRVRARPVGGRQRRARQRAAHGKAR